MSRDDKTVLTKDTPQYSAIAWRKVLKEHVEELVLKANEARKLCMATPTPDVESELYRSLADAAELVENAQHALAGARQ